MDVFDPNFLHPPPPQDKRSLEELTKNWLANKHVEIELELAKKFHLVEEKTKSDGTKKSRACQVASEWNILEIPI